MDDHWGIVTPRFTLVFAFAKLGARTSSIMIDIAVDNGGRIVFFWIANDREIPLKGAGQGAIRQFVLGTSVL